MKAVQQRGINWNNTLWIYIAFTIIQISCKCVWKYCTCDISAIVNESFIFTIVLMSHIPYLLKHLISSKYIVMIMHC